MKIKIKFKHIIFLLIALLIIYLFGGPLFPWNPIKFGYETIVSPKVTVSITNMTEKDSVVYKIEEIVREEEKFHNLHFKSHIKIIILDKDADMRRYCPWLKGSDYSVNLSMVNLIYIGPNARKSQYGIEVFIKHELSHELIQQNSPNKENSMEIQKQSWLSEGVATYFGGPVYYNKVEFIELCKQYQIDFTNLYVENIRNVESGEKKLRYAYYYYFIKFLIDTYGLGKLQGYISLYINDPANYGNLFIKVYSMDLNMLLAQFKTYLDN